jgi:signal transduction histidine kinase/CheY-like chemotaxis protein
MSRLRKLLAISFRAKVLVPVIFVMISLLAITAWIVDRRITKQFENEAMRTLFHADEGFQDWQNNRRQTLLLRVGDLVNEPRFKAALQTGDAPTVKAQTQELLNSAGQDVKIVLFTTAKQELFANAKRDPLITVADFEAASAEAVKRALQGDGIVDTIHADGKLYDVVSLPVSGVSGEIGGVLTFGMEIGDEAAEELSRFTRSQIVLLANNEVIVRTLLTSDSSQRFVKLFNELPHDGGTAGAGLKMTKLVLDEKHYYCSAGRLASLSPSSSLGYLLLYSYEDSWRSLQTTQEFLLVANCLAIVLGSAVICFLVGRVTQPLRELRDSAEAVGRGDFSQRVPVRSQDECGELATVFNRMTHNLKNLLEQLELTVETLKTTQAQLIQSEKLSGIGEFIAGVAHELNNPLTSVMGFSELLQKAPIDSQYKRQLEVIHKSALRCQKIVQALLSFARRRAPERKAVCVNRLIEAAMEILQYQLRTSNVEVSLKLDPHLPQAMVDPHQIQQVFVNLVNNARQAIEAHQPKGLIKVTTASQGETVRIILQDDGPGIPEENLSKIFDPFFTTKEVGKGTGLGLSLCYGIIKEHGGTITPRSRQGEGATFIIELPVTHEAAEAPEEKPPEQADTSHVREGSGKRVLVIDDEESILQMVREALTPRGYEVDTAPDGESGLRRMGEKKYDVALCDWKMPGLNGQEVYERARTLNPALSSRMIFITGDVINERTRKFLEQQNKICLPKPFTIAEFRAAIKKVLAES